MNINKLETRLKVNFKNPQLLEQALVHRSYLNEHPNFKLKHNERLEFLGDAVLELVVTEYLFQNYPNPEGELTSWRAALVNTKMLAQIASQLALEEYLLMSQGEIKDGGRARKSILANTLEAVIGATYLDQGYSVAQNFIKSNILVKLDDILEKELFIDAKSKFQEWAQENKNTTPHYQVLSQSGPDHDKKFIIGVYLGKELIAKGRGKSKQQAETQAAQNATHKIN